MARCYGLAPKHGFRFRNKHLTASTIADIYKARWQIELFFKCMKPNLKIKSFVVTSKTPC
ncbi:MAG: transposase [Pseudomonadales bacterium]|nr:transposase [Pseudomonadales bacterium]MCP5348731.1 transposase [Pseudomonadales bacterium]